MKRGVGHRAQLTAFIMVGLLLLVVMSLTLFLTYNVPRSTVLTLVPDQVRPVYDIVNNCVNTIGESAIRRQAAQGGYLYLPPEIEHTPTSYLALDEAGYLKVPLWYYDGEDRTPPIPFMERQLADEIRAGLPECINKFSALADQFSVEELGNISVEVLLAQSNVVVRTHYPLTWFTAGKEVRFEDFISILDVHLRQMWEFANATMRSENTGTLLENATIDLMSINPDVPFDSMTFDCTPKRWHLRDITTTVQDMLHTNIPTIRFKNTNYPPFEAPQSVYEQLRRYGMADINANRYPQNVPPDAYEYLHLFWDTGVSAPALRAALSYEPRWGMALTGNPNDNGVLESRIVRGTGGYLNFMCVNQYHITYDVIYPVVLTVRDDDAFSKAGMTFQMAFPVQIKTNSPNRQTYGIRSFRGFNYASGFCEDLGDTLVDLRAEGVRPGEDIGTELEDVSFSLRCVGRECPLGSSRADEGAYRLRALLPAACQLPTIVASKPGYLETSGQLDGDALTLTMTPLRDVKIGIVKHPYDLATKSWGEPLALGAAENVSIRITLPNSTFDSFTQYPHNDTIQLIDGVAGYDVTLLLAQFGSLTGGFAQEALPLDSTQGSITFHVLEGRPVAFNDDYRGQLTQAIYGTDYQARLAPESVS